MMAASPLRAARCATPLREAPRSSMSATLSRYLMVLGLLVVLATLLPAAVAHGDHGGHDHGHGDGNVHRCAGAEAESVTTGVKGSNLG
jgi:hypothetical protein